MHLDLAHAIVTGLIVFGVICAFQKAGWTEGKRFDWRLVLAVAVRVFRLSFIRPT